MLQNREKKERLFIPSSGTHKREAGRGGGRERKRERERERDRERERKRE